jgi:5'-nucleotidase (lipoprotein e(P4) family)
MTSRWPLVLAVALTLSCRSGGPLAPQPAAERKTGQLPAAVRWASESAEHRALFLEVYRAATVHVEKEAAGRGPGRWGVILDADETTIDNSAYQRERALAGLGFDAESWRAWCARREAVPLPGAAAFLARVRALGGKIAIVTNRTGAECPDTEAVFREHALAYDVMLCKEGRSSDKSPRFDAVARGTTPAGLPPLDVVAFVGDNVQDFPGLSQEIRKQGDDAFAPFGVRYFLVPNPMYGSWAGN